MKMRIIKHYYVESRQYLCNKGREENKNLAELCRRNKETSKAVYLGYHGNPHNAI